MDPSDRLRRDQERHNRKREHDRIDRHGVIDVMRTTAEIKALTVRIDTAERSRRQGEASEAARAQWAKARAAIEHCTAVTHEAKDLWLERLPAIDQAGHEPAAEQLEWLHRTVDDFAQALSDMSTELHSAAERRQAPTPIGSWLRYTPTSEVQRRVRVELLRAYRPTGRRSRRSAMAGFTEAFGPRVGDPLPEDLQPIRAKLLQMFDVPARFDWIHQLESIDTMGCHEWITSADKAETLARASDASAADCARSRWRAERPADELPHV